MVARLLRLAIAVWLAVALAAAWAVAARSGLLAGARVAALILCGFAPVLAAQFATMQVVNRRSGGRLAAHPWMPSAPPARTAQVLLAAWHETVGFVRIFAWRLPFRSHVVADDLACAIPGRVARGVVLVHGFCCNRGLWQEWQRAFHARGVPTLAIDLEPPFAGIDAYAAAVTAAIDRLHTATGHAPVVVAHSMGGLAVRAALRASGRDAIDRVAHVVTIGTPHHGTLAGALAPVPNARQMRVGSRWLAQLAADEDPLLYRRFTCFWSHCDNVVFPAASATLPGADNRHVEGVAHVDLVDVPGVRDAVVALLRTPAPDA